VPKHQDFTGPFATYRKRRSPGATPEPTEDAETPLGEGPRRFVVQRHAARRLHHDLRLEIAGALHSWALPKGLPTTAEADGKRAAFETEDHPLAYADFEGIIPPGNYGAGAVIVWDRGFFIPLEDPEEGLAEGKLLFELKGYKLRGLWTLVRTKNAREWLLIKKPPGWAASHGYGDRLEATAEVPGEESILSGLTVEELASGGGRAAEVRRRAAAAGAPRRRVEAARVEVMKPEVAGGPFSDPRYLFELKYDGFRLVAARQAAAAGGAPRPALYLRSGREATGTFPDLARAVAALPFEAVMDGEAVVLDEAGRPSFARLQRRGQLAGRREIERAALALPATLYLFDLLAFEEWDLRPLPLAERKALLAELLPKAGPLRFADGVRGDGEALFREVERRGLEGLVGKRLDSPYRGGRTADWLKIRADRVGDFAIVGFGPGERGRAGEAGRLHLAVASGPGLVYAGSVGAGVTARELAALRARLAPLGRPDPPLAGAPRGPRQTWIEPELVCEVRYKEWTEAGHLRQPVFLRLRDDKSVVECRREELAMAPAPEGQGIAPPAPRKARAPRPIAAPAPPPLTNPGKVFWPAEGYTKGDLLAFYRAVAPWLLPYLRDRPLVVDRYPDGIAGKSFYQKNAPDLPGVRTAPVWTEGSSREILYLLLDDEAGLAALANLAAIPLHVWSSRVPELDRPDWSILDLDPKGAPFAGAVEIALALRELCGELGLPAHVKTSGGSGLHVLLPLGRRCGHEQARQLAELLARLVAAELPEIATVERARAARGGRVYVDYLQNGRGKLLAAPFSVRPLPGAPVSTPLAWREVGPRLDPRAFTIATVPERLKKLRRDPLAPILDEAPDLAAAIVRLARRVGGRRE
jgi:bifunctional non-homologous end joining protein LigD